MNGKIWAEYWVDCVRCNHSEPLAEQQMNKAVAAAKQIGWRKVAGSWLCKRCLPAVLHR